MKYTLKFFGIPIIALEREDALDQMFSQNGGQFEICLDDPESDEFEYEEEDRFGFQPPPRGVV